MSAGRYRGRAVAMMVLDTAGVALGVAALGECGAAMATVRETLDGETGS